MLALDVTSVPAVTTPAEASIETLVIVPELISPGPIVVDVEPSAFKYCDEVPPGIIKSVAVIIPLIIISVPIPK